MKKIFIVTGEVSGDRLGAWYLQELKKRGEDFSCQAVGGKFLADCNIKIYKKIEKLNIVGALEVIKKLRFIFNFLKKLSDHILQNNFDEVILVDFPGFNLRLAKILKQANPNIKIIYLSPPQLWAWGQWRIKKLRAYTDKLIVLYPFEVEWYKKQGLEAEYWGNPVCLKIKDYFKDQNFEKSENYVSIVPGSRVAEIEKIFPVLAQFINRFKLIYPKVKFVIPVAESFDKEFFKKEIKKNNLIRWQNDILLVSGEKERLEMFAKSFIAISKPGTVSLELAILHVPTVIIYKTSWITYFLARFFIGKNIRFMSLPNLLLDESLYTELIQSDCNVNKIFEVAANLYESILKKDKAASDLEKKFLKLEEILR